MRSVGPRSDAIGRTEERTFAPTGTGTSEPSGDGRTVGNVLDTISREEASAAIAARRRAVLRQAGVRRGAWGALPFLLERAYDALIRSASETGVLHARAALEAWTTYVNVERRRGKRVVASTLKARFSEHVSQRQPIWYGDHADGTDGLRVEVAVATPGKHQEKGVRGTYGLQARITRGGRPVRVERCDGRDVLGAMVKKAVEVRQQRDAEEAIFRSHYRGLLAIASPLAADIAALAKRRNIHLGHAVAMFLAWVVLVGSVALVSCTGYVAYRVVKTYIVRNETRDGSLPPRLRLEGGDVQQNAAYEQRWVSEIGRAHV